MRMVHYVDGTEYRGVSQWDWIFRYKNPRYGEGYAKLAKDPSAVTKKNKRNYATKVKEYRVPVKRMTMNEWLAYSGQLPEDSATAAQKDSLAKLPKEKPNYLPPDEEESTADTTSKN